MLLLAFTVFVSVMLIEAGAQGRRLQPSQASASTQNSQARRKNIASVRSIDTRDGSRVTITSDVPLNDYEAYWGGDRFFVIIPNAEITYQNVQTLQASLRGQGFQDILIERKGSDLVFSFRMLPGFRARPEQKFNRLDIILTAPPGVVFTPNTNRNTQQPPRTGTGVNGTGTTRTPNANTYTGTGGSGGTGGTGGTRTGNSGGNTGSGGGGGSNVTSTGGGGGGATASTGGGGSGTRGGRSRGSRGGYTGYSGGGGGGGDRGGGAPLNIPLPSDMQASASPTPGTTTATPSTATTGASPSASPASVDANANANATAQTSPAPETSLSPTPEQIAQAQPPNTSAPATSSTETNSPAATNTGFAAAVKENWLPLLIGLLVLAAIGLLLASRSRADRAETRETVALTDKKTEKIKDKPATRTGAAIAGGTAGAAAVAAMSKDSRATAPAKEPVKTEETRAESKAIEPVAPAVGMERISSEVKSLLEGKDYDDAVISSSNPETRQIVATELMAALASRNPERQQRARSAFTKHGFFDEATQRLRTSDTPAERISAARSLGLTQEKTATPHLIAALEDEDPEVRRASVNALAELRDPSAIGPLNALLEREKNRKVPHSLIRRAIEASATIDLPAADAQSTPAATASAKPDASAPSTQKKDKDDDEDREVFEI